MIHVHNKFDDRSYPDFILFSGCTGDKPCVVPGTYALVGAAAVLCGVTRMTSKPRRLDTVLF